MIFYWTIQFIKKIIWLFALPKAEQFVRRDPNMKCPNCGWEEGSLRAVQMQKMGPRVQGRIPEVQNLCQHRCAVCGARWHEPPVSKEAGTQFILPSVARNEIEVKEDRAQNSEPLQT